MLWLKPKTDWTAQDYFNLDDWDRISGNAKYLHNVLGEPFNWRDITMSSISDLPFYTMVNDLEWNLSQIRATSPLHYIEFNSVTWYPRTSEEYVRNPSYMDFNRWEEFENNTYIWLERMRVQLNILKSGTFAAGNNVLRQYFSRRTQ